MLEADPPLTEARDKGLFVDEGLKFSTARNMVLFGTPSPLPDDRSANRLLGSPVATLVGAASLWMTDVSLIPLRLVSVFSGIATILLICLAVSRLGTPFMAIGVVSYILDPQVVLHQRLAITDNLMVALVGSALLAALWPSRAPFVAGLLAGLALLTKLTAIPLVLVVALVTALESPNGKRASSHFLVGLFPAVAFLLISELAARSRPLATFLLDATTLVRLDVGWDHFVDSMAVAMGRGALAHEIWLLPPALVGAAIAIGTRDRTFVVVALWGGAAAAALFVVRTGWAPARYALPLYPALCILGAYASSRSPLRLVRLVLFTCLVIHVALSIATVTRWLTSRSHDGAAATSWLRGNLPAHARVLGLWAPSLCFGTSAYVYPANVNLASDRNVANLRENAAKPRIEVPEPTHLLLERNALEHSVLLPLFQNPRVVQRFVISGHPLALYEIRHAVRGRDRFDPSFQGSR